MSICKTLMKIMNYVQNQTHIKIIKDGTYSGPTYAVKKPIVQQSFQLLHQLCHKMPCRLRLQRAFPILSNEREKIKWFQEIYCSGQIWDKNIFSISMNWFKRWRYSTSRVTWIRYLQCKMTTELVAYQNLDNLKYHFSLFTTNIENSNILPTDVQVEIVV